MPVRRWVWGAAEVLRAVGPLAAVEILLRTTDLPTTCRRLGVAYDLDSAAPPAAEVAVLPRRTRRTVLACGLVASRWPFGDTCLRRCLLTGHRLRRLGPVLRVGVRRTTEGRFSAHSWLEVGGRTLDPTATDFAALGSSGRPG